MATPFMYAVNKVGSNGESGTLTRFCCIAGTVGEAGRDLLGFGGPALATAIRARAAVLAEFPTGFLPYFSLC